MRIFQFIKFIAPALLSAMVIFSMSSALAAGQEGAAQRQAKQLCAEANALLPYTSRAQDAASKFLEATKLDPKNIGAYYGLGQAYKLLKRRDESLSAFQQAVKIDPSFFAAWTEIVEIYYKSSDTRTAETICAWLEQNMPSRLSDINELRNRLQTPEQTKSTRSQAISSAIIRSKQAGEETLEQQKQRLKKEIQANPDDRNLYFRLAWVCMKLGDVTGAGDARRQFAQRFPNDPRAKKESISGEYLQDETAKVKSSNDEGATTSQSMQAQIWLPGEMPLQVYLDRSLRDRGSIAEQDVYVSLLKKAFQEWAQASRGTISFEFTDVEGSANIICDRVNDTGELSHVPFAGLSQRKGGSKQNLIHITYLEPDHFYSTCLHEIGHALGLSHSNDPRDIMYITSGTAGGHLSAHDKERLLKLYAP